MKSIGFDLQKGFIRFCCLAGTFANPILVEKDKIAINPETNLPNYMDRFESIFENLIKKNNPDRIGYRLVFPLVKKENIYNLSFPYAILNLIAKKHGVIIIEFVTTNFRAQKFGLTQGTNMYLYCDQLFGKNPPYWDDHQKNAILSAWLGMKD